MQALIELGMFTAKVIVVFLLFFGVFITFFGLLAKAKEKVKGRLVVKNLNEKYLETSEAIQEMTLPKKELKALAKQKKANQKAESKATEAQKRIFVLHFNGDIRASTVGSLSEEITAILNVATPKDEVVLRLESPGGVVHGYGLAAAQLMRLRAHNIHLTVSVDKIAASGGYMMACVGNRVLAAPFAIIGSIGVIVQLPNFHRLLKEKNIDFEQHTAGEFKRTITMFGENTEEGREKLQHEIEDIHGLFKNLIAENRKQVDINKVATGEHWLALQALQLNLVDEIKTGDEYLLERSKDAKLYEICYEVKKPFMSRFTAGAQDAVAKLVNKNYH